MGPLFPGKLSHETLFSHAFLLQGCPSSPREREARAMPSYKGLSSSVKHHLYLTEERTGGAS